MKTHVERRQKAAAAQWNLKNEIVLIGAGDYIHVPGRADMTYPFRSHSEYTYLTDRERPGAVLAFDPQSGWADFVPRVTQDERVWIGASVEDEGTAFEEFAAWLEKRKGRRVAVLGCPIAGIASDAALEADVREGLNVVRRPKDEVELDRMRKAADASRVGYAGVQSVLKPGITERQAQIELEAGFFRGGGDRTAYDSIVGGGTNSAVLHFAPSHRPFAAGELILIDAGAEVGCYASDVTRTYAASGKFTLEQADIYKLVLATEEAAVKKCMPGTEYKTIHIGASRQIAQGLLDLGILKGNVDSLMEQDTQALFFPHGVGHLVGLGVRDAGGYLPGRKRSETPGLRFLRIDMPLLPGYTVTIEPGIYFIPALLQDAELRRKHRDNVNWDRVDKMLNFGGIRIEDNIHVTETGYENLTAAIPKAS